MNSCKNLESASVGSGPVQEEFDGIRGFDHFGDAAF